MAPGLYYALGIPTVFFTDIPTHEVILISKFNARYLVFGQYKFVLSPEPLSIKDAMCIMKCCGRRMAFDVFEIYGISRAILSGVNKDVLFSNQIPILSSWAKQKDPPAFPILNEQLYTEIESLVSQGILEVRVWGMQCIAYSDALLKFFLDKKQLVKAIPHFTKSMPAPPIPTLANSKKRGRHQQSASEPCDESSTSDGADEALETPSHKQRRVEN
ncbi:hypothetical protein ACEPAI_6490 [Sanghuangporus weigelae]